MRQARPERIVYRITQAGRAEFEDWVRELVGTLDREPPDDLGEFVER
ncbi:transcriptional regulator [Amycolatopsis sp. OK19-0408]|uniref:Transcriptional regulator n=1 Tax=Amycolatopsis iheyensis TaxID=2945988 RepID=A0A9X2NGC8_9PSEU|nr:transcriptional regulator [Amycolatopsis iheyensis]MCR6486244.1 transcriptional regulator [Amycolatopsis iheyensis]